MEGGGGGKRERERRSRRRQVFVCWRGGSFVCVGCGGRRILHPAHDLSCASSAVALSLSLSLSPAVALSIARARALSLQPLLSHARVRSLSHTHINTRPSRRLRARWLWHDACVRGGSATFPQVTSSRASASTPTCIHPLRTSDAPQAYQIRHDGKVLWVGAEDGDADGGAAVAEGHEMRGARGPGRGEEAVVVSNFDREQRLVGQSVSVSACVFVSVS